MIVCKKCKKFVKDIEYEINGMEDIRNVTGICKTHGRTLVDYDDYEEIVPPSPRER